MRLSYTFWFLSIVLLSVEASAQTFTVDPSSTLDWTGKKVTGEHHGTVAIKKGTVTFNDKRLVDGRFEMDMTSIKVLDIKDPKYNEKLTNHLKSDDFFNASGFPSSTFTVTNASPIDGAGTSDDNYTITGDLTIKGVKLPLSFPAKITFADDSVAADATTKVDRTKYNVRYGSGKFFEDLGDRLIYDEFEVKLHLIAKEGT